MIAYVKKERIMKRIKCPHCGKEEISKYGKRNGKQRYKCNSCNRIFLDTTKTIFSSTKLSKEKLYKLILLVIDDTKIYYLLVKEQHICGG